MLALAHVRISQPDRSTALILMLDTTESSKGSGVYFNVVWASIDHLSNMHFGSSLTLREKFNKEKKWRQHGRLFALFFAPIDNFEEDLRPV